MLQGHLDKEISKSDMAKKVEAWKTINSVLVRANSEFMKSLNSILADKKEQHLALQTKLEKGEGTEEQNATYIFLGGYIQCLEDILHAKRKEEV